MTDGLNVAPLRGDNRTPFDIIKDDIESLYQEAKNYLDGDPISTPGIAADVDKLKGMIRAAIGKAESSRKNENKPFDDGKAEVQARYNELIGETKSVKGLAIRALEACQAALTPWLVEQKRIKDEAARVKRIEAQRLFEEAQKTQQAANAANMLEREEADALLKQAANAQKGAAKAERYASTATGLRTYYEAEVVDYAALDMHISFNDPEAVRAFNRAWAENTVKLHGSNAGSLQIPGVVVHEKKEAR